MKALIVGDIYLPDHLNNNLSALINIHAYLKQCNYDIFICNLEAPFFGEDKRKNRRAILKSDKRLLQYLQIAKENILILSNNHITDYNESGMIKTIEYCTQNGFHCIGAGLNIGEASKPLILKINEKKIGILAFSEIGIEVGSVPASPSGPGVSVLNIRYSLESIESLGETVDEVWTYLHWGKEFYNYPTPAQREMAHRMINRGVAYVFGCHPHVVQGYETYNSGHIFYSLGNFIFPNVELEDKAILKWNTESKKSVMISIREENGTQVIDNSFCKLRHNGIPSIVKNKFGILNKKSLLFSSKYYAFLYFFYSIFKRFSLYFAKLLKLNKLLKDIIWFINRKFIT